MKTFVKIVVGFVSVVIVVLLAGAAYLFYHKDEIAKEILLEINQQTCGELKIAGAAINVMEYFPDISLALENVEFFEKKKLKVILQTTKFSNVPSFIWRST